MRKINQIGFLVLFCYIGKGFAVLEGILSFQRRFFQFGVGNFTVLVEILPIGGVP